MRDRPAAQLPAGSVTGSPHATACPSTSTSALGAGHRHGERLLGAEGDPAHGRLEEGGTRLVADEPVGQPGGRRVEPARARYAEVCVAPAGRRPAPSSAARRRSPSARAPAQASTNRTRVPGVSRAGSSRSASQSARVGAPDQPPAAGRGGRVDRRCTPPPAPPRPAGTFGRGRSSRGTASSGRQPGAVGEARARSRRRPPRTPCPCGSPPPRPWSCPSAAPRRRGPRRRTSSAARPARLVPVRGPPGRRPAAEVGRARPRGRRDRRAARCARRARRRDRPGRAAGRRTGAGTSAASGELDEERVGARREHLHDRQYSPRRRLRAAVRDAGQRCRRMAQ